MKSSSSSGHFHVIIRRSRAARAGMVTAFVVAQTALGANWDGEADYYGGVTYFDSGGRVNFYGNTDPAWNSSTPLYFSYNNSGHSILNQNIGWKPVQSIIYESTFTGNTTLQGSDGFDLYWKIENLDTGHHTVNVPISVKGTGFELNPINGDLTVGGTIYNNDNRTLQVYGGNGYTLTLNSVLGGSGGLTIHQNSNVILNNTNNYTGATQVNQGALVVGVDGTGSITSGVTVASGAILGGSGTITGDVTLSAESSSGAKNGGKLAAGNSTGTLTVNGNVNFNGGSIFEWELDSPQANPEASLNQGSYDRLSATSISGGSAVFSIVLGSGDLFSDAFWNSDKSWNDLFNVGSLASIFSSFSGADIVSNIVEGQLRGEVSGGRGYFSFSGSTLNYTAIPEPTTALAGLLLGAGLLRRRR